MKTQNQSARSNEFVFPTWLQKVPSKLFIIVQWINPIAGLFIGVAGLLGYLSLVKTTSGFLTVLSLEFFLTLLKKNKDDGILEEIASKINLDNFFTHQNPNEKEIIENAEKELMLLQETASKITQDNNVVIKKFLEEGGLLKIVICSNDIYTISQLLLRNDDIGTYKGMSGRFDSFFARLENFNENYFGEKLSVRYCPYPIGLTATINDKKNACVRMADFKVPYAYKNDIYINGTKNSALYEFYINQFKQYYRHSYKIVLLTGKSRIGKTTIFKKLLEKFDNNDNIYYFYSEEICDNNGNRTGFNAVASKQKEKRLFASKNESGYEVNEEVLDKIAEEIQLNKTKILVIDEIGPLQLKSKKFCEVMNLIFESKDTTLFATIFEENDDKKDGDKIFSIFKNNSRSYCINYNNRNKDTDILKELKEELSASLSMYKTIKLRDEKKGGIMENYLKYIGSQTIFNSKKWGELKVESASLTPASDGDLIVYIGNPLQEERPIVRIHSECVFAEVFDSDFCDCAGQLDMAMKILINAKNGILFYLRFDGRGSGLSAKVKATSLEMGGTDTFESRVQIGVEPEGRNFSNIALFLLSKEIKKITLLTNNPNKVADLVNNGIDVQIKPLVIDNPNKNVEKLYHTKVNKFNHNIDGY